ncbi:SPOR domain-containing protein [Dongia soli]|uniref:SPOR domain-containing protein n=1 Tax=Dongia soli TaxID=600628 RepID=A0ABU5EI40_9PROT|nr:SPOR domain-containing protein [Dongia soli]MDY0885093.1 SPOR domain-containing protein [Dongia soli]
MSDTPKPEQIQANVAAALSRLRGDVMPPITSSSTGGAGGAGTGGSGSGNTGNGAGAAAPSTPPQGAAPSAASSEPAQSPSGASPAGSPQSSAAQLTSSQGAPVQTSSSPAAPSANPAGTPSYFAGGLRADPSLGLGNGASTMSTRGMTASGPSGGLSSGPTAGSSMRPSTATGSSYFGNMKSPLSGGDGGNSGANQPDLLSGVEMGPPPSGGAYPPSQGDKGAGKRKRNRLLVLGGALVALAVIGAIWLGSGKSGQAPVITADTSPEKVKPTDAGGLQVPNQNVQVLENMNGQPQQSGETVLPPPEQPIAPPAPPAVTDTDAAGQAAQQPNGQPANAQAANGQPATGEQAGQQAGLAAPSVPAVPDAPAVPSAPATSNAASPAMSAQAPAVPASNATSDASSANTAANEAPAKPAATQTAAKPAEASKTTTQPTATAGGKVKIQLAAVKTEAAAKSEWAKLQKAHPSQLGKLNLIVQKFSKDGAVYYRIQAGPLADRTAAKSICSELAKQKQACILAR